METTNATAIDILKGELAARKARHPGYSLRAFARDLSLPVQHLSQIMKGQRGLTLDMAARMAKGLRLEVERERVFFDLTLQGSARTPQARAYLSERLNVKNQDAVGDYRQLQEDVFRLVADWYHYAILSLCETDLPQTDPKAIGERLGITPLEARTAIDRLKRIELLEEKDGRLHKLSGPVASTYDVPSAALRRHHEQILRKATEAQASQPVSEREFGAMTMAISPEKIPEAQKAIRAFRRRISGLLETGARTKVYCFSTQLFSLENESE